VETVTGPHAAEAKKAAVEDGGGSVAGGGSCAGRGNSRARPAPSGTDAGANAVEDGPEPTEPRETLVAPGAAGAAVVAAAVAAAADERG
jgi:hypothetical protein